MFTKQVQTMVGQLRGILPEPAVRALEDILGNCDQTLEHRAPVGVYIDGDGRIRGQYQRETLPQVCFSNGEPLAAVTASNPAGYFSSDSCTSDCVTGGLAFRAIGPSAMDETRISTLYVGSLLDLCGNPFPTGSGSEPVRFRLNNVAAGAANEALGKVVTWNGAAYVTTGSDVAFIDWTANGEFYNRWADTWEGWAVPKADRPTVTIGGTPYTAYEVMWVEVQTRFIEFQTTAAFAGGPPQTAPANVTNSWGADDLANAPPTATIVDRLGKAPGAAPGFTGLAIWDEIAGQYILVASSGGAPGDQLFRFQLTADKTFAATSVAATLLDGTLTPTGGPVTVHDTVGEWAGKNGYHGWCVLKSDTSQYEIVFMEGQSRWLPFTLTADMAAGSATATAGSGWGRTDNGKDPAGSLTVYDMQGNFTRAKSGARGLAVWNDQTDRYEIVECQSTAGAIAGSFSAPVGLGDSTVSISVTDWWGTQQDFQNPGTITAEVRSDRYQHWTCPVNGKAVAIYDVIDDTYVVVDSEKVAHAIEFTTNSDGFGAAATVNFAAGGESPGATAPVSDAQVLFPRSLLGAKGVGFWRNGVYTVANCQTKAGGYAFTTKTVYSGGTTQANQIAYWGTQQDVQNPNTTQTISDIHGEWNLSRDGAKGYAIFDSSANNYRAVWQETYAHHIRYEVVSDFTPADAKFDVTIDEPHSGQDPTGAATIEVRNVKQRSGSAGEKGSAYLDTVNSTPNAVEYIDLEPKDSNSTTKVRWGRCNTNWYKGVGLDCNYISVQESTVCDWSGAGDDIPLDDSDPNYQSFPLPSSSVFGYKVLLPDIGGCDPNLESGHVIGFMEASDGTYVCVTDYSDDAIGCAKLFTLSAIPGGWATMNGTDNAIANGGSGVDTVDYFVKGKDTGSATGVTSGRWRVPVDDLAHHHHLSTTTIVSVEEVVGPGSFSAMVSGNCSDTHSNAHDAFIRDPDDIVPPMPSNALLCDDDFGPLNIENPNTPITYIERLDNSQTAINIRTP